MYILPSPAFHFLTFQAHRSALLASPGTRTLEYQSSLRSPFSFAPLPSPRSPPGASGRRGGPAPPLSPAPPSTLPDARWKPSPAPYLSGLYLREIKFENCSPSFRPTPPPGSSRLSDRFPGAIPPADRFEDSTALAGLDSGGGRSSRAGSTPRSGASRPRTLPRRPWAGSRPSRPACSGSSARARTAPRNFAPGAQGLGRSAPRPPWPSRAAFAPNRSREGVALQPRRAARASRGGRPCPGSPRRRPAGPLTHPERRPAAGPSREAPRPVARLLCPRLP